MRTYRRRKDVKNGITSRGFRCGKHDVANGDDDVVVVGSLRANRHRERLDGAATAAAAAT